MKEYLDNEMKRLYKLVHYYMWGVKDDEEQPTDKDIYKAIGAMEVIALAMLDNKFIDMAQYKGYKNNLIMLEATWEDRKHPINI